MNQCRVSMCNPCMSGRRARFEFPPDPDTERTMSTRAVEIHIVATMVDEKRHSSVMMSRFSRCTVPSLFSNTGMQMQLKSARSQTALFIQLCY